MRICYIKLTTKLIVAKKIKTVKKIDIYQKINDICGIILVIVK